jgi:hypothetical protein
VVEPICKKGASTLSTFIGHFAVLGQTFFSKPESLPKSSDAIGWLLEHPNQISLVLGSLSIIFAWQSIRRSNKRLRVLSVICAALALSGLIAGLSVTTDRQLLREHTRTLVMSLVDGNQTVVESLVSDDLTLQFGSSLVPGFGKTELLGVLPVIQRLGVSDAALGKLQAVLDGSKTGRTQARVRVKVSQSPNLTWWRFEWHHERDGNWRVSGMRCLLINGRVPSPSLMRAIR